MPNAITVYNAEGDLVAVPTCWEICPSCQGDGYSSRYLGAYTADDLYELGQEFIEDYANGMYDRTCDECSGSGKVQEIDRVRATSEQIRAYDRDVQALSELRAMEAAERRMGC